MSDVGSASLLDGYRPLTGIHDEAVTADGDVRPHWRGLVDLLNGFGPEGLRERFDASARYMREAGVFYRVYETGGGERPWPLAPLPLVLSPEDWNEISSAMVARATLMEALLADVYGPGRLVRDGALPAALAAGNVEFLRPLSGVAPVGNRSMTFYAVDLGRGPDGRWWVLSDRTQAPSGAGYALENRIGMTRSLGELFGPLNVVRLAGFFQNLRENLAALSRGGDTRPGLLTPGPFNETYFEHAYLARYLGLLLVEGADLTVQNNQLWVRTVQGLQRMDVLWRRLDADFADPLELNAESQLGVAGLVRAARLGNLALVNALGSGFLEAPALMGFLPTLARQLGLPEPTMPSIATWWCGQAAERAYVEENLDALAVMPALGRPTPLLKGRNPVLASQLKERERERLLTGLPARGVDVVGQEVVRLSTMPVWTGKALEPRPFALRVFLTRGPQGWSIMPGGFCRIASTPDARAITMQGGDVSADVWVLSEDEVQPISLLPAQGQEQVRRQPGTLPARSADNLFWLGRYLERMEGQLRILRALGSRQVEGRDDPVLPAIRRLLVNDGTTPQPSDGRDRPIRLQIPFAEGGSLAALAQSVRYAAAVIRDRISPDGWRSLSHLTDLVAEPITPLAGDGVVIERIDEALNALAAFAGLAQENMNRFAGWRFLEVGRRLERGYQTCRWARRFGLEDGPVGGLDLLLELADSVITYRQRYAIAIAPITTLDLILLDPSNPRSAAFQAASLSEHLTTLPKRLEADVPSEWQAQAMVLDTQIRTLRADALDADLLAELTGRFTALSNGLSNGVFAIPRPRPAGSQEAGL